MTEYTKVGQLIKGLCLKSVHYVSTQTFLLGNQVFYRKLVSLVLIVIECLTNFT